MEPLCPCSGLTILSDGLEANLSVSLADIGQVPNLQRLHTAIDVVPLNKVIALSL